MEKIIQIGEGNFLRAFVDYYIQLAKENNGYDGEVVICQPRNNTKIINALKAQDCRYNVLLRGKYNGRVVDEVKEINCISRAIDTVGEYNKLAELFKSEDLQIVISNTTEAGICFKEDDKMADSPNVSFPAKLTALLYGRYQAGRKGLVFLPVELIESNGDALKECIIKYIKLWNLENEFIDFVNNECSFCNTLVDRIVTGHAEYKDDACAIACEPYECFIIQADDRAKAILPFSDKIGNISYVDDLIPYRTRKVRILNGAHTMSVLAAYHMGFDIVRDMMQDELMNKYIKRGLYEQVIPTINLPVEQLNAFADSVLERFDNPFIDHKLLDISLNSAAKFKARCLCSLIDYNSITGKLPSIICFGLAALINFYDGKFTDGKFIGKRSDEDYLINDSEDVLKFFENAFKSEDAVSLILSNKEFWDADLTETDGLCNLVKKYCNDIKIFGMRKAVEKVVCDE